MKKAKFIAIVGTQYVGKTKLFKKLVGYLGNKGVSIGTIGEIARECLDDINEMAPIEAQDWILAQQIQREKELAQQYSVIVVDRAVPDNYAYWKRVAEKNNLEENLIEEKEQEVFDYSQNYNIIFFLQLFEVKEIEDDGVRSTSIEWREEMHDRISRVLNKFQNNYNVPVFPLAGSKEEVFEQAKKILKSHLSVT